MPHLRFQAAPRIIHVRRDTGRTQFPQQLNRIWSWRVPQRCNDNSWAFIFQRQLNPELVQHDQAPLSADTEANSWSGGPAALLNQPIISSAASDHILRAKFRAHDFEGRLSVIVKAA